MPPTDPSYEDLTRALPEFINLTGLTGVEDARDEDEADSLTALIDALNGAGIQGIDADTVSTGDGRYLVADDHFADFARDEAEDCGFIEKDNPLSSFVDWDGWTEWLRTDYRKVEVAEGDFAGVWWIKP